MKQILDKVCYYLERLKFNDKSEDDYTKIWASEYITNYKKSKGK